MSQTRETTMAKSSAAKANLLFLNTILLGGPIGGKIDAARGAGFDQIELWRQDVDEDPSEVDAAREDLRGVGLGLADFQVLLDFDGAPGDKRAAKRAEALAMLDMAVRVGADAVLAGASADRDWIRPASSKT